MRMGLPLVITSLLLLLTFCNGNASRFERDRRMIGGRTAKIDDWTFAAALVFLQPQPTWEICTATVIDRLWLLTAAHCVEDIVDRPEYLNVKIYSKKPPADAQAIKIYGVKQIIVHPMRYLVKILSTGFAYSWDFDIALLKLNKSVPDDVTPATIAKDEMAVNSCRSAGWGSRSKLKKASDAYTKDYEISPSLQEIKVPLVHWEECYDFRNGDHKSFAAINRHVLCGGAITSNKKYQQSGCVGDSGSPLICNSSKGKVMFGMLLGGNPLCNLGTNFMIFSKVGKHKSWIYKKTRLESHGKNKSP